VVLCTTFPGYALGRPYFVYTDHPILANRYFPGGEERVSHWRDCLARERRNLEGAGRVFAMSSHATRALLQEYGLPAERVVRVNAGCNSRPPLTTDPERYDRQRVLFVGVDWERKGGPELLEAFRFVRRELPGARLTIVGCSPRVQEAGVEVVGLVPLERVAEHYARASVFCMPSRREPFGIVYLEAMRAGLPVVSLDLGAAPDFVIENETGHRAPVGDVPGLAARLLALLRDPAKCRRFGEAGRRLVECQYTWERTQQLMSQSIADARCRG
jgi:glycosyltransferase involved in cell wall biosynthesis